MYSKPKGLYIKHRDKPARHVSPRTSDEVDYTSSSEGRFSPRVDVENFGTGEITADVEPHWPRRNFEHEDDDQADASVSGYATSGAGAEPQPGTSKSNKNYPVRAKQYMVQGNSYKDLTRAKYITVPEPKKKRDVSPRSKGTGSVKSFAPVGSIKDHQDANTCVKPIARVMGTHRGYPNHLVAKQSHIATVRLPSRRHTRHNKMSTIKAIPRDGTIRTVKGYHVGHNATVRVHNTGHAIRHMKHALTSWDHPDGGTFKRSTILADRKEYYITQFAIELDRPETETFAPGEFLSGRVILEASANLEIRFVELLIVGHASVQFAKNDPSLAKQGQEMLINKRSFMMGTPDGRWNSVITAGKYVSKFKFRLPNHLPSTHKYESKEHGFNFEIGYIVKARICDEIGSASARSTHSVNNYVKVLLTRRFPFMVRSPFDVHSISNGMQPVKHSEYVNLSCLPIFMNTANIILSLDRSVFLAGDEIRVKLTTAGKTSRKIKSLTCELQQRIQSKINIRQAFNVVQIHEHEPEGLPFQQNSKNYVLYEFIIPTHAQFIPSYLQGCSLLRLGYSIVMTVKFKSCAGSLFLECPIGIGPCADPMNPKETSSVPVFNRPKRFPHFSKDSNNHSVGSPKPQNGTIHLPETRENHVTSTFKKNQGTQLFCCCIDEDTLR